MYLSQLNVGGYKGIADKRFEEYSEHNPVEAYWAGKSEKQAA